MRFCLWGKLQRYTLINLLSFTLNNVITCYDILEKWVISLIWKKTCCFSNSMVFTLLTKCIRNPNTQLTHFPIFFKWWQIVDLDVLKSSANSWELLHGLHFTNSFKSSWLKTDKHFCLGSSLNVISSESNFEKKFRTWQKTMLIFFVVSEAFLLFLTPKKITSRIWTFSFSILEAWDHRLNNDVLSFPYWNKNGRWRKSLIRLFAVAFKTKVWNV